MKAMIYIALGVFIILLAIFFVQSYSPEKSFTQNYSKLQNENLQLKRENVELIALIDSLKRSLNKFEEKTENKIENKKQREGQQRLGYDLELITWNWGESISGHFIEARGQLKNISQNSMQRVNVLVSFYDSSGNFVTSQSSFIEFDPILPGQISPFNVIASFNPLIKKASIEFKFYLGGSIPTIYRNS